MNGRVACSLRWLLESCLLIHPQRRSNTYIALCSERGLSPALVCMDLGDDKLQMVNLGRWCEEEKEEEVEKE